MVIYFGGVSLAFILQVNIYSEKGGEPERMLRDRFESSGKPYINSTVPITTSPTPRFRPKINIYNS